MKPASVGGRKVVNSTVSLISSLTAGMGLLFLMWILITVFSRGMGALNLSLFTKLPVPPGVEGGGLANAMVGTLILTALAALISIPTGMMAGIYLAEVGRETRLAAAVKFITNVMVGIPSIIVGVFVYALMVVPANSFSGYAGAASLAIIMLPVVVRTTEDMLRMVPDAMRESALALGAPRWRVTLGIVCRQAQSGLLTGVMLAIARVSGETAPLLFTALNSPYWFHSLKEPFANLTVTIFNYAMSPYADWQQQAWGASLLIVAGVLATTLTARIVLAGRK